MTAIAPAVRVGTRTADTSPGRSGVAHGVAWWTLLPLAALMAYGDGFWVMSLREAAGAIERMDSPFQSWLLESTLFLPVFVIAVLAATSVALARFGPSPRRARAVLGAALLVIAAGTLAGVLGLAVSSAYDYHLQSIHMADMGAMRDDCAAACQAARQHSDLALQVRTVGVGAVLMLVTNLLLVGWAVALRGGRMVLGVRPGATSVPTSRVHDLRLLLAAGLVGSAAIHVAVVPEHLREWSAAGLFFVVLAIAQLALGLLVLVRLDRLVLGAVVVTSAVPLGLWLVSRTVGMPIGPETWTPEAVGLADVASCLLEVVTLAAALAVWHYRGRLARTPGGSPHARAIAVLCLVAVTTIGLGATEIALLHAFGVPGESMSHGG